ncbi:anthionine synthetase N-terminal [Lactococcus lactis subsp. lactis IO-1]|nr:anthionine synthetase N-terminal [Lactococcus lactis subsp. lactis IO-1]
MFSKLNPSIFSLTKYSIYLFRLSRRFLYFSSSSRKCRILNAMPAAPE